MAPDTPSPLGEFEVITLMAVLQLGASATGSGVRDEIARRTGRAVARGAVYVTLDRLADKGLLASRLADASPERGGHPKRYFKVTATGIKRVRHALATFARMQEGLEPILGDR